MEEEKRLVGAVRRSYMVLEGIRIMIEYVEGWKRSGDDKELTRDV